MRPPHPLLSPVRSGIALSMLLRCRRLAGERPRDPHKYPDYIRFLSPLIARLSQLVRFWPIDFEGIPVDVRSRSASSSAPRLRRRRCPAVADAASRGMSTPRFDHLRALEAESIHILREVVAEFERPVMLYSIGKDSSVLLRLAQKAFYPGPIPVPAAAHRHGLQVPRDDRVPRLVCGGSRRAR